MTPHFQLRVFYGYNGKEIEKLTSAMGLKYDIYEYPIIGVNNL